MDINWWAFYSWLHLLLAGLLLPGLLWFSRQSTPLSPVWMFRLWMLCTALLLGLPALLLQPWALDRQLVPWFTQGVQQVLGGAQPAQVQADQAFEAAAALPHLAVQQIQWPLLSEVLAKLAPPPWLWWLLPLVCAVKWLQLLLSYLAARQLRFYETSKGVAKLHRPVNLSQKWASGGLAASSVDLVRLGSAWFDPNFIPAAVQQSFWTPQTLADGSVNEEFYALGWRHFQHNFLYCDSANSLSQEVSYVHHGGVSDGAQSLLVIYPKWQLVVAVNINTQTQNWCDFAREVSLVTKPFLRQIAPELAI